jgi:hypothetical protein
MFTTVSVQLPTDTLLRLVERRKKIPLPREDIAF